MIDVQRSLITIGQAAERLGLTRRTVERKIEQGVIPAFQLGGRGTAIRIDEHELGGFVPDVSVPDMLVALRDGLANLEFEALRGANSRGG